MGRKIKGLSFYEEEQLQLNAICKSTGMNESEVVRQLIKKAYVDKKTREIITKEFFWDRVKKTGRAPSSYNVHCVNEKNPESDHTDPGAVSLNNQGYSKADLDYFQHIVEKAKKAWKDEL